MEPSIYFGYTRNAFRISALNVRELIFGREFFSKVNLVLYRMLGAQPLGEGCPY